MSRTHDRKDTGSRRWRSMAEREEILAAYRKSELTQREFAQGAGICVGTLQNWLRQERGQNGRNVSESASVFLRASKKEARPISLLEVELEEGRHAAGRGAGENPAPYAIEFADGVRLWFGTRFAEEEIRRLVALLKEEQRC